MGGVWDSGSAPPSPLAPQTHRPHLLLPSPRQGLRSVPGVLLPGATKPAFWDYANRLGIVPLLVACPPVLGQGQRRLLHHNFVVRVLGQRPSPHHTTTPVADPSRG